VNEWKWWLVCVAVVVVIDVLIVAAFKYATRHTWPGDDL